MTNSRWSIIYYRVNNCRWSSSKEPRSWFNKQTDYKGIDKRAARHVFFWSNHGNLLQWVGYRQFPEAICVTMNQGCVSHQDKIEVNLLEIFKSTSKECQMYSIGWQKYFHEPSRRWDDDDGFMREGLVIEGQ